MPEEPDGDVWGAHDADVTRRLAASFRGELLTPGDRDYGRTRRVFNGMIDRRPSVILRCSGVADVMQGVRVAREQGWPVSIRGGGHGVAGNAVCDGGLMLDLSGMKGMHVDPVRRMAQGQTGLLLGEFDHETQAFGLATTLGVVSLTGIAGLTLGGGLGWLNGKYGLACDNVLAADVVTADGEFLTADASENEDLYWALRGGGGNFGVVTALTYQLHPVTTVLAGGLTFPAEQAHDALLDFAATIPSPFTGIGLQQMTGVASRVDPRATAFAHRDRQYDFLILSQWVDPVDSDRNIDWTRRFFEAMRPHLKEAVYVNNLGDQEHDRVRAAYGVNYDKLAAVKARYDPENIFRLNHNIAPAVR